MATIEASVVINRFINKVFAYVTDSGSWLQWECENMGSCNITKAILSLQHDQAITDIILRSNLLHHFQKKYYINDLS